MALHTSRTKPCPNQRGFSKRSETLTLDDHASHAAIIPRANPSNGIAIRIIATVSPVALIAEFDGGKLSVDFIGNLGFGPMRAISSLEKLVNKLAWRKIFELVDVHVV